MHLSHKSDLRWSYRLNFHTLNFSYVIVESIIERKKEKEREKEKESAREKYYSFIWFTLVNTLFLFEYYTRCKYFPLEILNEIFIRDEWETESLREGASSVGSLISYIRRCEKTWYSGRPSSRCSLFVNFLLFYFILGYRTIYCDTQFLEKRSP